MDTVSLWVSLFFKTKWLVSHQKSETAVKVDSPPPLQ